MAIPESCIAKKEDLENWPHLCDIVILDIRGVVLIIALKEKANLFLPLECPAGGEGEPVAIRYSLGWTMIGPVGGGSYSTECPANFWRLGDSSVICTSGLDLQDDVLCDGPKTGVVFPERLDSADAGEENVVEEKCSIGLE